MKTFKIPVTWSAFGVIEVEAESLDEAIKAFDKCENGEEGYPLPYESEYIDGSFEREQDVEIISLNNLN